MVTEVAGTLRVPSIAIERAGQKRTAHGVCLLLRLLLISPVLPVCGSDPCLAQDERTTVHATDDEAAADDQQKQRTAASALVTLAGIVLAGLGLVFIILLLGAWTRRIVKSRKADQAAAGDKLDSAGDPPTEPPGEDAT